MQVSKPVFSKEFADVYRFPDHDLYLIILGCNANSRVSFTFMNSSRLRVADRNQRSIVSVSDLGGLRPYACAKSQSRVRRTSGVISHQRCTPPGRQSILPFDSLTLNPSWPSVKGSRPKGFSGSKTLLTSASETELNFSLSR